MTFVSAFSDLVEAAAVVAVQAAQGVPRNLPPFSAGKVFTFLFLTLGPIKIIGPFTDMTRGRDAAFKRGLAIRGTLYAAIGLLVAATSGANTLRGWGISVGALQLTAGLVLLLVALKPVLGQYSPRGTPVESHEAPAAPSDAGPSRLALSPLAFPTIVTPWGIAVLIMLVALRGDDRSAAVQILLVTAGILLIDLLVMLSADRILRTAVVRTGLSIMGLVLAILQVALGVQAMISALPLLGLMSLVPAEMSTRPVSEGPEARIRILPAARRPPVEVAP